MQRAITTSTAEAKVTLILATLGSLTQPTELLSGHFFNLSVREGVMRNVIYFDDNHGCCDVLEVMTMIIIKKTLQMIIKL